MMNLGELLTISSLSVEFRTDGSKRHLILDRLDLSLNEGEALSLVGESGAGKTILAMAILGLLPDAGHVKSGHIFWKGVDLLTLNEAARRKVRGGEIAMIFQDPQASLNPVHTVGKQITWLIRLHQQESYDDAIENALALFKSVKLTDPKRCFDSYPRELSGGMCQRVMIAMALACRPKLLIADEPTSALDVTSAAGIVELIADVRQMSGLSVLFITHDLGIAARVTDNIAVLDQGRIVDRRPITEAFGTTMHPMTRRLLKSYESLSPKLGN